MAKLQLEIPHKVFSVPSEVNYLADVFSRAFSNSRFAKNEFSLSKIQASKIPPLTDPTLWSENELFLYFSTPLTPEELDDHPKIKNKIQTPRPIRSLYKLFKNCTPEQKYYSALRLLQGWNDPTLQNFKGPTVNIMENLESIDSNLSKHLSTKLINKTLDTLYPEADKHQRKRLQATLQENIKKFSTKEIENILKKDFLARESEIQTDHNDQDTFIVKFCVPPGAHKPSTSYKSSGIDLPIQDDLVLNPYQSILTDTKTKFLIPKGYYGQIAPRSSSAKLNLYIFPGVIDNDYTGNIKIVIRNLSSDPIKLNHGTAVAQLLIIPILHPELQQEADIVRNTERGDGSFGSSNKLPNDNKSFIKTPQQKIIPPTNIELSQMTTSILHDIMSIVPPSSLEIPNLNLTVSLPSDDNILSSIWQDVKIMEKENFEIYSNSISLGHFEPVDSQLTSQELTH